MLQAAGDADDEGHGASSKPPSLLLQRGRRFLIKIDGYRSQQDERVQTLYVEKSLPAIHRRRIPSRIPDREIKRNDNDEQGSTPLSHEVSAKNGHRQNKHREVVGGGQRRECECRQQQRRPFK